MDLIGVIITLVVIGLVLYLIESLLPIDPVVKRIIQVVVVLIVVLYLLGLVGFVPSHVMLR